MASFSLSPGRIEGPRLSGQVDIDNLIDGALSLIEPYRELIPSDVVLTVAVAATVMVGWWLIRKLTRLALYAAVVGAAAWLWYFGLPE